MGILYQWSKENEKLKKENEWVPPNPEHLKLTKWNWLVSYPEGLALGKVDIGAFTYINARFGVEIGNNVQIGSHCSIYSHNTENNTQGKVIIEDGARIGSHSLILPNAHIYKNQKIKAYSIIKGEV